MGSDAKRRMPEIGGQNHERRFLRGALLPGLLLLCAATGVGIWHLNHDDDMPPDASVPPPRESVFASSTLLTPLTRPPRVSEGYVGSSVCRECHGDVWERYQSHPMAHSLSPVIGNDPIEDYVGKTVFSRGKREYSVERVGERVFHHEKQIDDQGAAIYDQAVEVHYAIGSGNRGRSYIIDRGGLLFQSPITWYSQAGRWDLSPGYLEERHERFGRRIVDRCISCHAGRAAPDPQWADRFQTPPIIEFGIGCERCHGPGEAHVAWHIAAETPAGADPIVNPARLEPPRRESVCNQCHLHGDAEILRYGRTDFDFRPGMNLGEVWSMVMSNLRAEGGAPTEAVSQVQQMLDSKCARRSEGRLGCVSCHDPHCAPPDSEKLSFFRKKCLACHVESDCLEPIENRRRPPVEDFCTACHMPQLSTTDVPHATQTDHRIPRRPGLAPDREAGRAPHPAGHEAAAFDQAHEPLSNVEQSRIWGLLLGKAADLGRDRDLAARAEYLLDPIWRAAPDDRHVGHALAAAWGVLGKRQQPAMELWARLLTMIPVDERIWLTLATIDEQRGMRERAIEDLDRLLKVNPWHASSWRHRGRLQNVMGRKQEALASLRRALEIDPSQIELYKLLAELCDELDLADEAARLRQTVQRLQQQGK